MSNTTNNNTTPSSTPQPLPIGITCCYVTYYDSEPLPHSNYLRRGRHSIKFFYSDATLMLDFVRHVAEWGMVRDIHFPRNPPPFDVNEYAEALLEGRVVK